MEVKTSEWDNEIFGIELVAENETEKDIIQRFYVGGIKINGITGNYKLQLTFKDLVEN